MRGASVQAVRATDPGRLFRSTDAEQEGQAAAANLGGTTAPFSESDRNADRASRKETEGERSLSSHSRWCRPMLFYTKKHPRDRALFDSFLPAASLGARTPYTTREALSERCPPTRSLPPQSAIQTRSPVGGR